MTVYVLIAEAIYDHGVIGVFWTEERAREVATDLWGQTDGHHRFRIEAREVDAQADPLPFELNWKGKLTTKPPEIQVVDPKQPESLGR